MADPVYDTIGHGYTANRRPDPRWADLIATQLRGARTVVNVGAGTGSYEPASATVLAVEPSAVMVAQRGRGAAPAVRAAAAALPVGTGLVDAAMAVLTVHHWTDWPAGLAEMVRIAPLRLMVTIDFAVHADFWLLRDYLPDVADDVAHGAPTPEAIASVWPDTDVIDLPLPADMTDGVLGAHWRRPEAYLDPTVRANCSPLALATPSAVAAGVARLADDLASGAWTRRYGELNDLSEYDLGYRLLVSRDA